jgi:hypothetical protein
MKQTAHRRMIRGKMKPEARIDLHGMTLSEAHPALVDFVIDVPMPGDCAFFSSSPARGAAGTGRITAPSRSDAVS